MRFSLCLSVAIIAFLLIAGASIAQPLPDRRDVPPAQCPPEGTAKSGPGQELNRVKNRITAPLASQIDPSVTLNAILTRGYDEDRFDEDKGAVITGWVVDVQQGGHPETANCGSMSKLYTDTHITIGLSPDAAETATMVVEVTPRWRELMAAQGQDWRTETLQQQLIGRQVQIAGWLMFDDDHFCEATNTRSARRCRGRKKPSWRRTVWEIHPITGIQVVP